MSQTKRNNQVTVNAKDQGKLRAFLRTRGVNIRLQGSTLESVIRDVWEFCRKHGVRVEVVDPNGVRIAVCTCASATIAAAYGYLVAGIPGAIIGAVGGAIVGIVAAHHRICVGEEGDAIVIRT